MKSILRRIFGKSHRTESDQSLPRDAELENLEPRMLFSAAPVEAPDEGGTEPQAAEESVIVVSQEAASATAIAVEGAEIEDDPEGLNAAQHSLEQAAADTTLAVAETDVSAEQNITLVNVDGVSAGLNQETLDAVADAAKQRWIDSGGLSGEQVAALDNITYQIDHLDAVRLGSADGNTISVDGDAWGKGWFIDATPFDDSEFGNVLDSGALSADGGLGGRVDLLTVLLHEQGHILGLNDLVASGSATGDVTSSSISVGTRLLPEAGQAIGATPGSVDGPEFVSMTFSVSSLGDSGVGTLREAIGFANANPDPDFIEFGAGGVGTISLTSGQLTITDSVHINSLGVGGVTIDAGGTSRVFEVQGGTATTYEATTFDTLTISGGLAGGVGGGVYINGRADVTFDTVLLTGNTGTDGGGFYVAGQHQAKVTLIDSDIKGNTGTTRGGGFRNSGNDTTVTMTNGEISGNTANDEHGGGFYNNGTVILTNVDVDNNQALDQNNTNGRPDDSHGGGFFNNADGDHPTAGRVILNGGSITNNTAYGHGGGFWSRGFVEIKGTAGDHFEIQGNSAGAPFAFTSDTRSGGGFWSTTASETNLTFVDFNNAGGTAANTVRSIGAGIDDVRGVGAGFYNTGQSKVTLTDVTITDHLANQGGAFYQDGIQSEVIGTRVTLDNNTARDLGGAFRNATTGGLVRLTDSSIDGNIARFTHGGGFYNNGTVELTDTTIDNNEALDLNGGVITNLNAGIGNSTNPVQRESYGGGFYNTGGSVTMTGGSVNNNDTYGYGGGFVNSAGEVDLTGTEVDGNEVVRDLDLDQGPGGKFSTNYNRHGGGFWNQADAETNLTDVILSNNKTGTDQGGNTRGVGGGFWNTDGSIVNIDGDSQLIGNRGESGGAFYNTSTGSVVNIAGTKLNPIEIGTMADPNSARTVGGGIRSTTNTVVNLSYVDVNYNTTDISRGGGAYVDGGQIIGDNVRLNNNKTGTDGRTGDEQGGGFWLSSNGAVTLTDSEINNNESLVHGGAGYNEGSGLIDLTRTTVEGNFANNSGGGFFLNNSSQLELTDSSVSNNIARDHGGGLWVEDDGKITALRTNIDGNLAGYEQDGKTRRESGTAGIGGIATGSDLRGGGFWASGRGIVTLTDSTLNDNETARHGGGGNLENESQLILDGTTVSGNVANNHGGGFRINSNAHIDATNSTISGNYTGFGRANNGGTATADYDGRVGGGIWSQGGGNRTILNHVTLAENRATAGGSGGGAGIYRSNGFIQAENSILYGNIADAEQAPAGQDASDVRGAITLVNANVLGAHSTSGGGISGEVGNRITADPVLAPLADNGNPIVLPDGGTPRTHAIANTSVASGAAVNSTLGIDQRGSGRPGTSTATTPTNINATGASLLSNPDYTELDRNATVSGSSIVYGAGAVDNEDLFDYVVLPEVGEFPLTGPITVTIDFTFTKVTGDQDFVFQLSNGHTTLSWNMNDNNGGDIIFGGSTIISDGEPALGVSTTATFEFVLDQNGSTLNATRNGFSGSNSVSTVLGPMNGLTFSARLGNAGEQTQVDNIAVTYTGLTGQTGGTSLGAFEANPEATTLAIDDLTIPENAISGTAFDVEGVATSTGAGPLTYSWTVDGAPAGSGAAMDSLTVTNPGTDPVQTVDVTLTVTDTTTNQTASETRQVVLIDPVAMPTTGTGTIEVDTAIDEDDGAGTGAGTSLREAIKVANASSAGTFVITFAAGIDPLLTITGSDNSASLGDLDITKTNGAVSLIGNGISGTAGGTTIDGGGTGGTLQDRIFDVRPGASAFFTNLTITGGVTQSSDDHGAGLRVLGANAIFKDTAIDGNSAKRGNDNVGGGLYMTSSGVRSSRVYMTRGTVSDNLAESHGGGIYMSGTNVGESLLHLTETVVSDNSASDPSGIRTDRDGGGLYITDDGNRVVLNDVTVDNNTTRDDGGGAYFTGADIDIEINGGTWTNNFAGTNPTGGGDNDGGGFFVTGTRNTLTLTGTNIGGALDGTGQIVDGNHAEDEGGGFRTEGQFNTINLIDVTIQGNRANDGGGGFDLINSTEVVNISGDSKIIDNFSATENGGGFRNQGIVNITGTAANPIEITGNQARLTGVELQTDPSLNALSNTTRVGGGFYNTSNGKVTLTDVQVEGNIAHGAGGGFYNSGGATTNIDSSTPGTFKSTVSDNHSVQIRSSGSQPGSWWGDGGGFYNTTAHSSVNLTDVVVDNNNANDEGAGFYSSSNFSEVNLTRTNITNNTAQDNGGGFYNASNGSEVHLIDDVLIDGNISVTEHGGGFRNNGIVDGKNATISNNVAVNGGSNLVGGGFYNASGRTTLVDSSITGNHAGGRGGGYFNSGGGLVDISSSDPGSFRSVISGNKVTVSSNDGGGFFQESDGSLTRLTDVDVKDNSAGDDGGGFYNQSENSRVELTGVNLDNNTAADYGGGFYNASSFSTVSLTDTQITDNDSTTLHGGGFRNNGQVTGTGVVMTGNRVLNAGNADRVGGAFFNTGGNAVVTLTDFDISDNFANARGGGVFNNGAGVLYLTRGTISNNIAGDRGGGFYQESTNSRSTLTNVTVSGNRSGRNENESVKQTNEHGGGVYNTSSSFLTLDHVTIADNDATGSGGGIRRDGGIVTLINSIVADNKQNSDVGAGTANDVSGTITGTETNNVEFGTVTGGTTITSNPGFGALADNGSLITLPNGGVPQTHSILASSDAVDAATNSTLTEDARGFLRAAPNDLGAYETGIVLNADDLGIGVDNDMTLRINGSDTEVIIDGMTVFLQPTVNVAELIINGQTGDDRLTVDYGGGDPLPLNGLTFNGNGNAGGAVAAYDDILVITGGTFGVVTHTMTGPGEGTFDLETDSMVDITYTGLEPVDMTGSTATDFIFNLPAGPDNAELTNIGGSNYRLASTDVGPTFEQTDFALPSGSITINGDPSGGGGSGDSVTVTPSLTLGGDFSVTAGTINLDGGTFTTTGNDQSYNGAVNLGANTSLTGNDVTLGGTVDSSGGTFSLNVVADGDTTFQGNVGENSALLSITTDAPGNVIFGPEVTPPTAATLNYDAGDPASGTATNWIGSGNALDNFPVSGGMSLGPVVDPLRPGITGAYTFDGTDGTLNRGINDLPGDPSDNSASFEFWIKPDAGVDIDRLYETGGSGDGTSFLWNGGTGNIEWVIDNGSTQVKVTGGSGVINLATFNQVVGVYHKDDPGNGGNDRMELYINGQSVDVDVTQTTLNDFDGGDTATLGETGTGLAAGTTSGDTNYEGQMAIFRFYETPLTAVQVATGFNQVADTASATALGAISITTTGDQTYNDAASLEDVDVTINANDITFDQTIDGADAGDTRDLTINSSGGGVTTFNGAIGGTNALGSLTTNADGRVDINTTTINTNGSTVTFNEAVLLGADLTITEAGAGDVTFGSFVESASGSNFTLTVNTTGGGDTIFRNSIGSDALGALSEDTGLGSLTTDAAGQTIFGPVVTTPGADFNADATLDTDADDRWEDTSGVSGLDFEIDDPNVSRMTGVSALPGIDAAYDFPGGSAGNVDGALLSDAGTATRRSFTNAPGDWSNEDVTIEIWFKPDNLTPTPTNGQILFEDGGGTGFGFFVDNNELRLRKAPGGGNVSSNISGIAGEFIQAVGTYDVSAGTMELFVNGISAGTATPGGNDWSGSDPAAVGTLGGANTGGIGSLQQNTESFDGQVAIFRVYRNEILSSTDVLTNFNAVSNPDLTVTTTGTQTINDAVVLENNTVLNANDVALGSTVNLNANDLTLNVSDTGTDSSIADSISGTGGLIKQGDATLVLNGDSSYSGDSTVEGGTLRASNTTGAATGTGTTTAQTGTVLDGDGAFGPLTTESGSLVQPGVMSLDTLGSGDFSAEAGSTLEIELEGPAGPGIAGGHDQLVVTGTVTLMDSELDLVIGGSFTAPAAGTEIIIIDNDGVDPVSGEFNGYAEGSLISLAVVNTSPPPGMLPGQLFEVTYTGGDGNDVALITIADEATTNIWIDSMGNLKITDFDETVPADATGNTEDTITVRVEGTEVVITDPNNTLGTLIPGATQPSANEVRVAVSLFTGDVMVETQEENDFTTIGDLGSSVLPGGITVDGGDGFDNILHVGDGSVLAAGGGVIFDSEEIEFQFSDLTTTDGSITLNGTGGTGVGSNHQGIHLFDSDLTANGGGTITLNGSGGDSGNSNAGVLLTTGSTVSTSGTGGGIDIDGTGGGTGVAGRGVMIYSGSSLSATDDGTIDIDGTGAAGTLQSEGVFFNSGTSASVVNGDMTITGTGGGTVGGGLGISITNTSLTGTGAGGITITGTSAATGGFNNGGVQLWSTDIDTTGGTGSVTISGSGAAAGTLNNMGVRLSNVDIDTGGDAGIDIDGTGAGSGASNIGVQLTADANLTVSGTGTISIDGTGGAGTVNNDGVRLAPLTNLNFENGDVTISGTGAGGSVSQGLDASGLTMTGTGTGNVSITGTSSASGSTNQGISLSNTVIDTTAGSGSITLTGTGSTAGTSLNDGVKLSNTDLATGANGNIEIDGTGGGTGLGALNSGVTLATGSTLSADGSGTVMIDGTAGSGTVLNRGVYISGAGSSITSGSGAITINGTGNGTASLNRGVETGFLTATTTGTITLAGTGSTAGTGVFNTGIYTLASNLTGGNLSITGIGGTGTTFNEGVRVVSGSLTGTLTLTGTANTGTTGVYNSGVYILNANLGGATGSITGAGGGGTGFNHGIYAVPAPTLALNGSTTDGNANSLAVGP